MDKEDAVPLEQHQRAIMNVMQMDSLRRSEEERAGLKQRVRELEIELAEEKRQHRELSELSGSAIVRAHVARGDRELDVAKRNEELDELRMGVLLVKDLACDLLSFLGLHEEHGEMPQKSIKCYVEAMVDDLDLLVSPEDRARLSKVIVQRQRQADEAK